MLYDNKTATSASNYGILADSLTKHSTEEQEDVAYVDNSNRLFQSRHGGKINTAFLDGHAEGIVGQELADKMEDAEQLNQTGLKYYKADGSSETIAF